MSVCFWSKSVMYCYEYLQIYGLCWHLMMFAWKLYNLLLLNGMLRWMCVKICMSLCLMSLVLKIRGYEALLLFENEHKLEYFKLKY